MNWLKSASLILCIVMAGCSSKGEKPVEVAAVPEPVLDRAWLDDYEPRLREALKDSRFVVERRDGVLIVTAPVDASVRPVRAGVGSVVRKGETATGGTGSGRGEVRKRMIAPGPNGPGAMAGWTRGMVVVTGVDATR